MSVIFLFDVDGTLTQSRRTATPEMLAFLADLSKRVPVGLVGGSDIAKITEQIPASVLHTFPYVFAENGCVAFRQGTLFHSESIAEEVGEATLRRLIDFSLRYIADLDIPVKRGTFIEYRKGMLNLSPIGRNCSQEERDAFYLYDQEHGIRKKFQEALRAEFASTTLQFSIGGQISIDVFPQGWDKTHCLPFLSVYETIHFFGDKTQEGGNDYEIFVSPRTVGHSVTSPEDTVRQVSALLAELGL
mmetsp:Transcript_6853/g.12449  ORF Transcript_6853/g.12449 Transcript_6853/m.12449 type:complete len:245 (+) Transcript_6853:51-785(+)|eukprot:CAMPEP_0204896846 /NCGR_PEP_ID=MMETSP1397-20131031/398_1 /ASSEMBLY_ACC=CAM_ASM_000891 /TAXON_ID=49980 /ORGANISM="Climacostomum Climacostomum virens, Strain Stock W-24" /LENGTH=244 /DNA_ID=CAMNT_0052064517 /DNA_START=5 /DNA_END=739 /DNA_ORIENTATION=+